MSDSKRSHKTPPPYHRPTDINGELTRREKAWGILWKMLGIALMLFLPLVGVVWHQADAKTDQIDKRMTRVEERTVRALESIDTRLTFIEQRSWTQSTPAASSP